MTARPAYFEAIRRKAANDWELLEERPDLAGPWRQLFIQVQSPRHVLSELLQNADDAGATEAVAAIEDDAFVFRHNGGDFTEEHFSSLCRFGYSNKRALHTIGFRGIGFKSTFSLGDTVELRTPTLAICFHKDHFTEPAWIDDSQETDGWTTIRVAMSDGHLRNAVRDSFSEWRKSPISLLFFRNIRRLRIGDEIVHWHSEGRGPVADSEWFSLDGNPSQKHLFVRSKPEPLPKDVLDEVRKERLVSEYEELDFPPCQVEIILGTEGRLFVVLPTGVKTDLPFACNAPFLQDSARYKIKDTAQSKTNRWLLERIGRLAGEVMLGWLNRTDLSADERALAYSVMPDVNRENRTLEGACGTIVEEAFESVVREEPILLSDDGDLVGDNEAILLPRELFNVWPKQQVMTLFDEQGRPSLSHAIADQDVAKLKNWGVVEEIDHQDILNVLQEKHFPKPGTWRELLTLWTYLDGLLKSYSYHCDEGSLRIVPVQGKDVLLCSDEVVRLGEKRMVPSEDDWQFLGDYLSVLNQNWMRFLAEQRRLAEGTKDKALHKLLEAADHVLEEIGLDEPSDTSKVIDTVAESFFAQDSVKLVDAIRLAHIAAKLGAQTGDNFKFACQDRRLRTTKNTILYDDDGSLGILLPDEWAEQHVLHPDYTKKFESCSKEEWDSWVGGGRAGLAGFIPLKESRDWFYSRKSIDAEMRRRGYAGRFEPRYSSPSFRIADWDFGNEFWEHWQETSAEVPAIWARIVERVLSAPGQWSSSLSASVVEVASNGHERRFVRDGLAPSWLLKLSERPCLRDTNNAYRKPDELLMRTPQTEALRDIEPFVHGLLDSEATKPILKLLGVSSVPTGPEKLLARLQALSSSDAPPAHEVDKWYRRLDQLLDGCPTEMLNKIRSTFEQQRLILTENGLWENTHGVFLFAGDEDVPDAPIIRAAVRDLSLWRTIGVGDRPTAQLAIQWLKGLESGKPLAAEDTRRVKNLLTRYPRKVWNECGHWLSLAGEWSPVEQFSYGLSMQTLTHWSHLHQWVKQAAADFRNLPGEFSEAEPFDALPSLASHIEERFHQGYRSSGSPQDRPWLQELGQQIRRIKFDDTEETDRVRDLGTQLSTTKWLTSDSLEIVPYIDGKPAGTPRRSEVLWLDGILYAENKPLARLAKAVAQEIGKAFRRPEIIDAIKLCFDRNSEFVISYMEENFDLIAESELPLASQDESTPEFEPEIDPPADDASEAKADPFEAEGPTAEPASEDEEVIDEDVLESEEGSPEEAPDDSDDDEISDEVEHAPVRRPRPQRPSIMERFALLQGFKKDGDSHFFNDQGSIIGKANGSLFPWELRNATGNTIKRYWPKDHCLDLEPLQLEAEIWSVLETNPNDYVLILNDADGQPIEIDGRLLTELRERGVLALHPSTYRLVIEHEKQL